MLFRPGYHIVYIALLLAAAAPAVATEIYKHTDADGSVTYSDQPPAPGETAEKIPLRELNTTPAIQPSESTAIDSDNEPQPQEQRDLSISIVSPADETTIAMGPGDVTVTAEATPPLGSREQLQLFLDNEPHGEPQRSRTWQLKGLLRGPHDLAVARLDRRGKRLDRSDPVRIYVLRPSVNQLLRP
ncbi:MAG: DUF4124 domain-containing protein [Chromatocurvus sp.]